MELSNTESTRRNIDLEYDGFFNFVEVGRLGNQRIVHREGHSWLGVIDDFDNILLPLIYDKLIPCKCGVLTVVDCSEGALYGFYNTNGLSVILPAIYTVIYPTINAFWCLREGLWELVSQNCEVIMKLSYNAIPLNHYKYICILKKTNVGFKLEVLDEKYNNSQCRLREIAHESDIPNRIKLTSGYCNLIIYSDIYGNVLYSNADINNVLSLANKQL